MSKLFEPTKVAQLKLKNHFMRSPCYMHNSDKAGVPNESLLKYYREMADGQMGLIIPGCLYIHTPKPFLTGQGGMNCDYQADAWKETVDYIHKCGSKIVFQLCDEGTPDMSKMEIAESIEHYVAAARRAQRVGVDGVEIHAAHGFLVSQFLSPVMNKRNDEYGGSPEKRRRILQEIVTEVRKATGKDFFISAKINGDDCTKGGITPKDFSETVKNIKGMDMYEVSCGLTSTGVKIRSKMIPREPGYENMVAYNLDAMEFAKKENPNVPFAVVGGFRRLKEMETALDKGASLISLGRPTIADPKVVSHLMEGSTRVKCVSCGQCIIKSREGPVRCFIF